MPAIGIDLGGTKCLGVLLGDDGCVLAEHRVATPDGREAVVATLASVVVALGGAPAVGVGAPGLVDRSGVLRFAPNLPGVVDVPLRADLEARLGVPVRVDNDATCAVWAERELGAAKGCDDAVLVTLGTGIGGGIVAGGRLQRGANGFAGEVGHMVVNPDGPRCGCGRRGCWEQFGSGSALGRLGAEAAASGRAARVLELAGGDPAEVRGQHVTAACAEGDAEAAEVMAAFARWVALGLASLASALDPDVLVIGGGVVEAGELLLAPTRAALAEQLMGAPYRPQVAVVAAELGEHAGAIGAALVAREA